MKTRFLLLSLLSLVSISLLAGGRNDIQSCYAFAQLAAPKQPAQRSLILVVDETTQFDEKLKLSAIGLAQGFIAPGDSLHLVKISAYVSGHYAEPVFSGQLEPPPAAAERDTLPKKSLQKLDLCLQQQLGYARTTLASKLNASFGTPGQEIEKSDLLASFKQIAESVVRQAAADKVVLILSDMLENSGTSSFYAQNQVRELNPAVELKNAIKQQLITDFAQARIFVMGAGLTRQGAYRTPQVMTALKSFWQAYFDVSQAKLIGFGQPALLEDLR